MRPAIYTTYTTLAILLACLSPALLKAQIPSALSEIVRIRNIPHVKQKPDFCGEACIEMVLRKMGVDLNQDDVFDQSGLDPMQGRGCYTRELTQALHSLGFDTGKVGVWIRANDKAAMQEHFVAMINDLRAGYTSIICMRTRNDEYSTEHFRLLTGFDAKTQEIIYHEPAEANGLDHRMSLKKFYSLWPLKYKTDQWLIIRFRLKPGEAMKSKLPKTSTGLTDADYAQHALWLKSKLPHQGFSMVLQPPFVVVGDESKAMVERRAKNTVKWAVDHLKKSYFSHDPDHVITIWLFKDKRSYDGYSPQLFKSRANTPYGYYSSHDRALVMNIATGGGTLVHEIVHPFIHSNFKGCPSWFDEGLASLYEQSAEN